MDDETQPDGYRCDYRGCPSPDPGAAPCLDPETACAARRESAAGYECVAAIADLGQWSRWQGECSGAGDSPPEQRRSRPCRGRGCR